MKFFVNIAKALGFVLLIGVLKREINKLPGFVRFVTLCAINLLGFFSIWGTSFAVGYKFVPPEGDNVRGFLFMIIVMVSFLFSVVMSIVLYIGISKVAPAGEAIVGGIDAAKKGAETGVKVVADGVSKTKESLSKGSEAVGDVTKKGLKSAGKMIEAAGKAITNSADGVADATKRSVDATSKWTKETGPIIKDAFVKGSKSSAEFIKDKSHHLGEVAADGTKKVIDAGQKGIESSSKWAKKSIPEAKGKIDELVSKLRKKKDQDDSKKSDGE